MTTLRFLTLLLISALSLCSCSRRIQCAKVPGTVNVDNSYSIRATELTVREYLEFIASNNYDTKLYPDSILLLTLPFKILIDDLSKQGNFKYFKSHKQTTGVWLQFKKQGSKNETRRIKSIMFMPITAISYDQAKQYCRWLVVGVADQLKGQMPMAFAVVKSADSVATPELAAALDKAVMKQVDDSLGAIARPSRVHFLTVLPKTRSGKLLPRSIQALAEGRDPGDLSTLDDPNSLEEVRRAVEHH